MRRISSTLVAAEHISADAGTFASLPQPLALRIFLALAPDERGRASCVCRAWRDMTAAPSLWTRLDMSGVSLAYTETDWLRFNAVLLGAAGRARGQLRQVDTSQHRLFCQGSLDRLLPVLTASAGSLRELHLHTIHGNDYLVSITVEAVMAAAPLLQVLTAEYVCCVWQDAPRLLRAEPPFALLQMRRTLYVYFSFRDGLGGMDRFGPFAAALADAALHPMLSDLIIWGADTAQPALMGALVDAALARRLHKLKLEECMPPAAAPLARLLAEGSLAILEIDSLADSADTALFEAAGAALVADALRMNTTLTTLCFDHALLCLDRRAAELLLGALVGHSSLRKLRISGEVMQTWDEETSDDPVVFGSALGALIAVDAPALQVLVCNDNDLEDDGLAPIVEALPLNHHLRVLDVSRNSVSEAFAREWLLPAVRANTALREFALAQHPWRPTAAEAEAAELVRSRSPHDN